MITVKQIVDDFVEKNKEDLAFRKIEEIEKFLTHQIGEEEIQKYLYWASVDGGTTDYYIGIITSHFFILLWTPLLGMDIRITTYIKKYLRHLSMDHERSNIEMSFDADLTLNFYLELKDKKATQDFFHIKNFLRENA